MDNFLNNLKKAVDTGEFNSEAAKKIIEINKLADERKGIEALNSAIEKAVESGAIKKITDEEGALLNSEYEKKMGEIKIQDAVNVQIATLVDIEDMVQLSIGDMMTFVVELENKFENELKGDSMYAELSKRIEEIKSKYSSIINN